MKYSALFLAFLFPILPLFASPKLPARVTWIGNSYPGGDGRHVPQDIDALCVTPDGRVFSNVFWEEGGGNVTEFKDGKVLGNAGHTHGWGHTGGKAIACNSKYLYIGTRMQNEGGGLNDLSTWPPKGKQWLGISRRPLNDIKKAAPFAGAKGGKGGTLKESFLIVAEVDDNDKVQDLPGIAADEKRLYVSCPSDNTIKIYDAETMAKVDEWKIERPGPIALAKDGTLWMLQAKIGEQPARLVHLDSKGKLLPGQSTFEATSKLVNLAIAPNGNLLLPDQGPDQQLRIVSATGIGTAFGYGFKGGIFSTKSNIPAEIINLGRGEPHDIVGPIYETLKLGTFGDLRFNNPSAIGFDAQGNSYVAQRGSTGGGSTVLESYDPQRKLRWRLFGLNFVDMADVDPDDDTRIFTKEERFSYDYTKTGTEAWKYDSYTVNPWTNPQDPRLHIWSAGVWARRIGPFSDPNVPLNIPNPLCIFVNDMNAEYLQVYTGPSGFPTGTKTITPMALFSKRHIKQGDNWPPHQPAKGEWIWRDKNRNGAFDANEYESRDTDAPSAQGWWVDEAGGVWLATEKQGLRYFPYATIIVGGRNNKPYTGNPTGAPWTFGSMQEWPHPAEFDEVKRIRYDVKTDTLYLGGTKGDDKNQHWKPMGPVLARYDGWLKGDKKLRWQITAPYQKGSQGHSSAEPMGFDVAGDYIFVPYTGASKEMKWSTGHIEVFRADNGQSVGYMEPGADIGEIGLQDIRECLRAHQRKDGEYIVFLEEDYKAKILMYRWKP
jgi:hypothetical protein